MKRKILLSLLLAGCCLTGMAQIERPKLVVGLVVDQMRWDYLYYYYDQYGEGGLKRLLNEGFSCENTMINYLPTVTAIGHSSIYTGSVPALTGITGNNFYEDGKEVYCVSDATVQSVGSANDAGKMSPRNLLATGIGDMLKMATDGKSKVIGVALKDRAAILPAGHGANAAYWWDTKAGHFITSTYYMNQLPKWVEQFNKQYQQKPGTDVKTSNLGVTLSFKMAEAAVTNESLGADGVTDMLALSISSTDAIGHTYGTRGKENHDVYMQLDKDLTEFLNFLDQHVGKGNYLLFLSADHGAIHNANVLKSRKLPGNYFVDSDATDAFNKQFQVRHGFKPILGTYANSFILDHKAIESAGLKVSDVKQELTDSLMKNKEVYQVVDYENATSAPVPALLRERIINGYHPHRSGDLYTILNAGVTSDRATPDYKGTGHCEWNPYDSHIPLVFMGWKVRHGETSTPTRIVDIAPTVCAMLHIQMPNACVGDAIQEVVNP